MRRLVAALVVAVSITAVSVGVARSEPSDPAALSYRTHYTRFYAEGPSAQYDGDTGGIGGPPPVRVRLPAGSYLSVLTVSFEYRTHNGRAFEASMYMRTATVPYRYLQTIEPAGGRLLPPAPNGASTTLVFEVRDVPGNRELTLEPSVNRRTGPDPSYIVTSNVVVDAQFRLES